MQGTERHSGVHSRYPPEPNVVSGSESLNGLGKQGLVQKRTSISQVSDTQQSHKGNGNVKLATLMRTVEHGAYV